MMNFIYGIEEAITPLDGRNKNKIKDLTPFFSEFALDRYRILVELKYFQKLSEYGIIRKLTKSDVQSINRLYISFSVSDYKRIREIEKKTNHDLKAVEEYIKLNLKSQIPNSKDKTIFEMVHFGLTSDDVNNIAYALIIKGALKKVITPELIKIETLLKKYSKKYASIPMLGRTHGQPAVPTTVGKEFLVYYKRLKEEIKILQNLEIKAKCTGNVGNLNVHAFVFPNINWLKFSTEFIKSLGLVPDIATTQIEPYDSYIRIFNTLERINTILIGMSIDFWIYISFGYFKQKVIRQEVGSTALPHKVNPIYFEGAEGGFGIANALLEFYCRKLSHSRLQRDLSDSTVRRSFGIAFGYCLLSYQSIVEALLRIEPNTEKIKIDLNDHWEVLSEGIQNYLRTKGYKDGYEKTKFFFRGKTLSQKEVAQFINELKLNKIDKEKLLALNPEKYIGYAEKIVNTYFKKA